MRHDNLPNVTPEQLRARALKSIETAERLLEHDSDAAAREVAFAGECILKARYCSKNRKPEYPGNRAARKALEFPDRLFKHDLDTLLTVTEDVNIKTGTFHSIDWDRLTNWQTDFRYVPVDTVPKAEVAEQVSETRKLYWAVRELDLVEGLQRFAAAYETDFGAANLIGVAETGSVGQWQLWLSANSYPAAGPDAAGAVHALLVQELDGDVATSVTAARLFRPDHGYVRHCQTFMQMPPCCATIVMRLRGNIAYPLPTPPPLVLVRCCRTAQGEPAPEDSPPAP